MIVNRVNPDDPIHLEEVAQACVLAPFLLLGQHVAESVAGGGDAPRLDERLGLTVQALWTGCTVHARYIEEALWTIREVKKAPTPAPVAATALPPTPGKVIPFVGEPDTLTPLCIYCSDREADPSFGEYCSASCCINAENEGA